MGYGDRQRVGTGFGLAIRKGLAEAMGAVMGGAIRAETGWPDGRGTRIVLTLPPHTPEVAA